MWSLTWLLWYLTRRDYGCYQVCVLNILIARGAVVTTVCCQLLVGFRRVVFYETRDGAFFRWQLPLMRPWNFHSREPRILCVPGEKIFLPLTEKRTHVYSKRDLPLRRAFLRKGCYRRAFSPVRLQLMMRNLINIVQGCRNVRSTLLVLARTTRVFCLFSQYWCLVVINSLKRKFSAVSRTIAICWR